MNLPPSRSPLRVMHLISCLDVGGAEMMLSKLLGAMGREQFTSVVWSMTPPGRIGEKIRALGIEVRSLDMGRGIPDPRAFFKLRSAIREWKPDVLQTWMYHADFLGALVARFSGNVPVIWNIRNSEFQPGAYGRTTLPLAKLCGRISSSMPVRILSCSEQGRRVHEELGYDAGKMLVIPNGFDLSHYNPQPDAREFCETHFGISKTAEALAVVGRYHPQKDHKTFLTAAGIVAKRFPDLHFILCGDGVTGENPTLVSQAKEAGISSHIHLLGRREPEQLTRIMSRSILVSSSRFGEGFPNVVGEAMACGAFCVVTNSGDSGWIVGDTGVVVQPGSPDDLAAGIVRVLTMSAEARSALGAAAMQRVADDFTIQKIARRYEDLYRQVHNREPINNSKPQPDTANADPRGNRKEL